MANSNGWGDGSANNNIGWGQGAVNNNVSWGKSQIDSWSGATDIDGGNPPVNSVAPALSGTAQEGQTLTCSTGTWSGTPTYSYQWKRNGSNIGSATNSTYTLVTADVGQSIKCTVTATNALGSSNADSNTVTPTSSVDPDAQAFITAAAITNPTQQAAINTLVTDLKGYNIWTKFKAIYPIVGGVASSHAVNLKTPGTYNLTFATGWTHSANGMTPLNAFADTFLNAQTVVNTTNHLSYYSRTLTVGSQVEIGVYDGSSIFYQIRAASNYYAGSTGGGAFTTTSDARGFWLGTKRSSNDRELYFNGASQNTITVNDTNNLPNGNIYLGARKVLPNSVDFYSNKQCAFASIGDGLTDTEVANYYTAVQAYQTALSRNV